MQRLVTVLLAMVFSVMAMHMDGFITYATTEDVEFTKYTILMEATSKQILEESNSNVKLQVGTLSKVMVALLVAEKVADGTITLGTELTASNNAQGKAGATVWLLQGERMSVEDLLKATLIGNANDSTVVLAEYLGGSEEGCLALMNAKAQSLGMDNTKFSNVCGYEDTAQYSTAYDMGILGCEVLKYEFLYGITSTYMDYLRDGATELVNENYLTRTYDGLIGIKASHLGDSNYSSIVSAQKDGIRYVGVVLDCPDKDSLNRLANKLLNKGFNSYVTVDPSFSSELMKPLKVTHGTDTAVLVRPKELRSMTVAKGSNDVENVVFLPEYIEAPVKENQRLGVVCFYVGDTMVYQTDLVASNAVDSMTFPKALKKVLYYLLR